MELENNNLVESILFLDLDDTLFQTKFRNKNGLYPATKTENSQNISYMTEYQNTFLNMILSLENIKIIPLTARILDQYNRTFISKNKKITLVSLYFGGLILENGIKDIIWEEQIKNNYEKMKLPLNQMYESILEFLDKSKFRISILDNYYISIKNKDKKSETENIFLLEKIKEIITDEYFIHFNNNNIAIVPNFIDKKEVAKYFISKYNPKMTIGMGDSISDFNFMSICDFKIIPSKSQIEKLLFTSF